MSSVDDRIVNMKFNNSQFGQGVDKTKRDLTGLEKTLTSAGRSKGMTQLGAAANGVKVKFSALQVAGAAALGTIVSKATTAGLSLLKSFTIQPLIDGFKEYQTGLQSVQTIMANTGRPVKEVNKALDQLNDYADKTIYNFAEMAKNVGTFTAAGVDLKTSVASIKGIANLAALSGSNSQQASTAMYQLSQAIAAGKVGLQDWNSVVNAGMGGKVFQTALARTAINMGDLTEGAMKFEGRLKKLTIYGDSFRQSISAAPGQTPWLTGEALVETLKQVSGGYTIAELRAKGFSKQAAKDIDKLARDAFNAATQIKTFPQLIGVVRESIGSTFAEGFRIILGDFTQSKRLWGDVGYAIIGPHGFLTRIQEGFTNTLKGWAKDGGRQKVIKGFKNMFTGLGRIAGAFRSAFTDIFPSGTGKTLVALSEGFKDFTRNLIPSRATAESLRSIFRGVFSILHLGITIVVGIAKAFGSFFGALFSGTEGARGGILSLLGSIGEVLASFDAWATKGGRLTNFLSGLGTVAGAFLQPIVAAIGLVIDGFTALASGEGIGGAMAAFDQAKSVFGGFVSGVVTGLDRITAPFDGLKSKIADFAMVAIRPFQGFIDSLEQARLQIVKGLGLDTVMPTMSGLETLLDRAKSKIVDFANNFSMADVPLENVGDAIQYVIEKINVLVDKLDISSKIESIKASVSSLFDSFSGGGGAAASAGTNAMAASADATGDAFNKLGDIMSGIGGAIKTVLVFLGNAAGAIGGIIKDLFPQDALEWASMLNLLISGAIIKKLFFSKGVFDSLGGAIRDIGDSVQESFGALTNTLKTLQTSVKAEMIKNIAIAVGILVASLLVLSFIPMDKLKVGLSALAGTFALLAIMLAALAKIDAKMKIAVVAAGLVLLAASIVLLTAAVAALGFLPLEVLKQGLAGIATVLAILTVSLMALSGNSAKILAAGGAMVLMATAITTLVAAIAILGVLPLDTLKQGLAGVAAGIAIMTLSLLMLSGAGPAILAAGGAMILMATALDILVGAIVVLGLLPWAVVEQGLQAVALGIGIMTLSLLLLAGAGPAVLAAGAAMVMMAFSMNMLMSVILLLGAAPWSVVEQGLMAMAIALGILLGAGAIAMVIIPGLAALASVILSIGAAMLMAGTGMALFVGALALLAAVGAAAVGVIVLAIGAFIALLPNIAIQVAAAFVSFVQAIALAAPKIRKAFSTIFREMLGTVRDALPEIEALINALVDTGLGVIETSIPRWVEAGFTIIDRLLKAANDHVPSIVKTASALAVNFIQEMGDNAVKFANAGADVIIKTINGLAKAVEEKGDQIRAAAGNLARVFVGELGETLRDMIPNISLPDIPMPDLPAGLSKLLNRSSRAMLPISGKPALGSTQKKPPKPKLSPLEQQILRVADTVNAAIEASVRLFVGAINGAAYELSKSASNLRRAATKQSVIAESRGEVSAAALSGAEESLNAAQAKRDKARGIKDKGKRAKALRRANAAVKKAEKLRKDARKQVADAERQANQAEIDRLKADYESQKARDAVTYKDDLAGLGNAKSQQGQDLAERSADLLASAQAKSSEIKRLEGMAKRGGANAKKYLQLAAQLRKEAAAETAQSLLLGKQAIEAQTAAVAAFAAARKEAALDVIDRMSDIRQQQIDEKANREWQNEFEAADNNRKLAMLEARAAEKELERDQAQAALAEAYAQSDALASEVAKAGSVSEAQLAAIQLAMENAEKNAAIATKAADEAEADRDQIKQIKGQQNGPVITPSRTALEDAALAVDRYTSSVAQAEEMAMATPSTTQFVQNNYSPEALSASTIYRQTNNLISAAEVKMGGTD